MIQHVGGFAFGGAQLRVGEEHNPRDFYAGEPTLFIRNQLGVLIDAAQAAQAESVRDNARTATRSGHGVGKSTIAACIIAWWIYCHSPSLALVSAPTRDQLYDVLWSELARIIAGSPLKRDFIWTATGLRVRGAEEFQVAQARTSNNPQALAGRHSPNTLLVLEEASGISEEVFMPAESTMTSPHARMLMVGNPTLRAGAFFRAFNSPEKDDYTRFHISSEDHPRVATSYVDRLRRRYGADSDVYRVRVKGEFPVGDPGTFILMERVLAAQQREAAEVGPPVLAVDCAGMGDDRTVLLAGRGLKVFKDIRVYSRLRGSGELCGHVLRYARELRKKYPEAGKVIVVIDGGGLGWGPAGDLMQAAKDEPDLLAVVERQFGGAGDGEYSNEASWMWGRLRDLIDQVSLPRATRADDSLPDQLADEVSTRKYELDKKGKILIEPKADYKETHDGISPDLADALVLFTSVYGWEPAYVNVIKSKPPKEN